MMRMLSRTALLACFLLAACNEEDPGTQVMVVIDAEASVRSKVYDVDVVVKSGAGDLSTWSPRFDMRLTQGSDKVPWPLELALIPRDGDTSRNYLVTAIARDQSGRPLAEVRAISGYVEGRSLSLPLVFDAACLARKTLCDPTQTCRAGGCINPYVAPSTLLPFTPGERPGDDVMTAGEGGAGTGGDSSDGGGSSGNGGDAAVSDGGDGAVDECADDPEACEPDPMIMCDDERCAGCPENFLRLSDDSCSPLLIGLELSQGRLVQGLSTDEVSYDIDVPLLTDTLSFTLLVPAGVTIDVDGEDLEGPSFEAGELALGESTVEMTLRATGHTSRRYTFKVNRSGRERTFIKAHNTGTGDNFGHAVAMQGDTIVIGAPFEDSSSRDKDADNDLRSNSGAAYVIVREGDSYRHAQYLKADPILEGGELGIAIAIDGDWLAIGAPGEQAGGSVYIYRREGKGPYAFQQRVTATPSNTDRRFGAALALKGGVLAVGAPGDNAFATGCGAIYVHTLSGTTWTQEAPIGPDAPAPYEFFGSSVALQGDAMFVGATGESNDIFPRGALYALERRSGQFVEVQRITEPDAGALDFFGESVAIEGDTLVVGAFGASGAAEGSGSIYVYAPNSDQLWERRQRIGASNPGTYAGFGLRIALLGNLMVTGAPTDDSGARGVNGDLSVGGVVDSGGGYVFNRSDSTWSQLARIKSDLPEVEDKYACGVAAEGDTIVFGAPGESSTATDIDGDPAMNGAKGSGAVYIVR